LSLSSDIPHDCFSAMNSYPDAYIRWKCFSPPMIVFLYTFRLSQCCITRAQIIIFCMLRKSSPKGHNSISFKFINMSFVLHNNSCHFSQILAQKGNEFFWSQFFAHLSKVFNIWKKTYQILFFLAVLKSHWFV
jgi:hypothetical protein